MTLLYILIATLSISLISFIGVFVLMLSKTVLQKVLLILVALAGGGLMGGAFLHLIPESIAEIGSDEKSLLTIFALVIFGFCLFLIIEQFLHWHHHHHVHESDCDHCEEKKKKPMSYLILFGDGVHNLIDGLIIAASFMISPMTGVITTIAVALHEIPQEIGDFGVLVYSGFKRWKALLANFLSGLTAVLGGLIGYIFAAQVEGSIVYLLPVAAGGFLYIAASDLVPEIKHGKNAKRLALNFFVFLLGISLMLLMKFLPFAE